MTEAQAGALLEAAFAVCNDTEIRRVASREFCGKLDDLKKAIALAEGTQPQGRAIFKSHDPEGI